MLPSAAAAAVASDAGDTLSLVSLEPRVWGVFEASLLELVSSKEPVEGTFRKFLGWFKHQGPFEVGGFKGGGRFRRWVRLGSGVGFRDGLLHEVEC
jgi:hypothetical protein